jgi:hypothetical protein
MRSYEKKPEYPNRSSQKFDYQGASNSYNFTRNSLSSQDQNQVFNIFKEPRVWETEKSKSEFNNKVTNSNQLNNQCLRERKPYYGVHNYNKPVSYDVCNYNRIQEIWLLLIHIEEEQI